MTSKQAIVVDGGAVYGPYTPGVRVGDNLWLSGQIAPDAGDLQAQVAGALAKIDALLEAGGTSKHDLVAVQVLLEDIGDFAAMNEVWCEWVDPDNKPARATVQAEMARPAILVEIQVTAAV